MSGIEVEEYLTADDDIMVFAGVTEEDILSEITDEMENDEDDTDPSQSLLAFQEALQSGRGGLVVRSRPLDGGLQARNPIPLKSAVYAGLMYVKLYVRCQKSSPWCGPDVLRGWCQLRCPPSHSGSNYEFRTKISTLLLQNETLM
ncbi:hypothetical protein AVEN_219444-1 [Araneus ventricosus]|uniref:Uncharacterized protein n=1 Tax=Araneus ventricosus TaxID=182803 RepID=A0A4Y2BPU0_ARAVE|nr:hypothetical protein AVEN_219444-1 [Araneus ventricosus]